ncbi:MAG TPA: glycosyltransferase, partial [Bacillota bacterium]|nr:glycosyltransferase [Bacillota bacterium]
GVRYILAMGNANYEKYSSKAKAEGLDFSKDFNESGKASYVVPYIHDMAAALAASDLVVSRAGALTLAEITANGIPSVLVPHPYVPDDVQRKNARAMEENGAAVVIEDPELDGEKLARAVTALAAEPERLEAMGKAAKKLAMPKAASLVADLVERHMRGGDAR